MHWPFDPNPVTIKRWRRFRHIRRAWWSLNILLLLFSLSLASELLCNNTPLLVRHEGHLYFPVIRFYPEDIFLHNNRQTRPDYKQIARDPAFQTNPKNRMIFPPIPYGPFETTDPDTIRMPEVVILEFIPNPHVIPVTISRDLSISRTVGAEIFTSPETSGSIQGHSLTNIWIIPDLILRAFGSRWRNEASPACTAPVPLRDHPGRRAELALSEFTPRATPPSTIRFLLREMPGAIPATGGTVALDSHLRTVSSSFPSWETLPKDVKSTLTAFASEGITGSPAPPLALDLNTIPYTVKAILPEVRWPFKPVPGHWLGIDSAGRDVLARLLYGLRMSMTFGFMLVALTMTLGTLAGAVQGFFGKTVDIVGQRITEIWSAIPFLYVMILLGAVYGRGFILLLVCYAVFNWIGISYYVRAEFLRLRHLPFVEAARALGLSRRAIMIRHIMPNAMVPLITFFPFQLVGAIGSLAALDYLGFGLPPPTPSWGELLSQAQQFKWAWWLILYPALALFIVMLLGVFVGEGIRNAYDPRPATKFE